MITVMVQPLRGPRTDAVFAGIVSLRWPILVIYAALLPGALWLALGIPRDNSLERMIVASNPEVAATREFQRLFGEHPVALLLVESPDPFLDSSLLAARTLEAALGRIPGVSTYSALTVWERMRPGAATRAGAGAALREFVSGTSFFREQGLVTRHALAIVLALDVPTPVARDRALDEVERVVASVRATAEGRAGISAVRRVGKPWLDSWLERETGNASLRFFPLFGAFVVALTMVLYRSVRALAAILVSLAVAVLLGMAFARLAGFGFTIVSSLVPLTLMITTSASLVYLHSRFVDQAEGDDLERHRVRALTNKVAAVSVSMFAAAVGFAALAVSDIVPIRQLGIWISAGIGIAWAVCFTLYPALQVVLRAPTRRQRAVAGRWMVHAAAVLPRWSYRWRWVLLPLSAVLAAAGLVALVGVPGVIAPMRLATDALDYVDPTLPVVRDTRAYTETVLGRTSVSVWVTTPPGRLLEPAMLSALDDLSAAIRRQEPVGSVVGLPAILRLRRYAAGQGDHLPADPAELARAAADLEPLLLTEPALRAWVDVGTMGSTYLTVTSKAGDTEGFPGLERAVGAAWADAARRSPALSACSFRIVGLGVLEHDIAAELVPTLSQSFAITFTIIFLTFLLVFRSGPARIIAMVPSLFAILVMFLVMRLAGIQLNVATILIATTVLGATENDQVHFFYHFQEARNGAPAEQALAHAIRVAGHAIVFATVINAGGFLALILSNLPPMRQFGILTASAFALALVADFTSLLSSLWVVFRERPEGVGGGPPMPA
jgi:uncharacterized protein